MKRTLSFLMLVAVLLAGCATAQAALMPSIQTSVSPDAWARVPAGKFLMGQHNHETLIDYDYEIMVTDVTNAQYARYLNEALVAGKVKLTGSQVMGYYPGDVFHNYKHEKRIDAGDWLHVSLDSKGLRLVFDGKVFAPAAGYDNHPMVQVTWFGAKAYCEFYGWRLPSEAEWEKAARGTDGRPFPWGETIARNNANYYDSRDPFEKGLGKQGDTTPVGFYRGATYDSYQTLDSPSPYGVYDMAGNVWQWTADIYEGIHYRFMRGGSKGNYDYNLRVWTRNDARPDYYGSEAGFRCVR